MKDTTRNGVSQGMVENMSRASCVCVILLVITAAILLRLTAFLRESG